MTSRERVRKTLRFEEPDRVPVDWGMMTISGIHEVALRNLLDYLGWDDEIVISDRVQGLAIPPERLLEKFHVDTRVLWANPPSSWKYDPEPNGNWYDENGAYFVKNDYYCDFRGYPLGDALTIEDLKKYKMSDPVDAARFEGLRAKARNLYENTEYALVGGNTVSLYYMAWTLRGYENFMADTACDEKFANYILDMIVDWWKAFLEVYLKEIGEYIDIMWAGDDWGGQDGPLIAPDEFRKNVAPRFKELIGYIKYRTAAKVAYHSCGSVLWCMDDFIDMGVDIVQPLQANAKDMQNRKLIKEKYYGKLVLHGGLDNQGKFHLDEKAVEEDAKAALKAYAPGGGYLFASGHNIQANCPPQNIIKIFETCEKYGKYPVSIT